MRFLRFIPTLFFLMDACIEPLDVKIDNNESSLVVDGLITQEPGPYEVKLFYSVISNDAQQKRQYESGATVWITDDIGHSEQLTEVTTGTYQTDEAGLRGEIGRSYHIRIRLRSGSEYVSEPQLMTDPGTINSIPLEYEANAINGDNASAPQDVINIYLNAMANAEQNNLFRWRWSGVYETRSYPELRDSLYRGNREPSPAPAPCSGYIIGNRGLEKVGECTCCICWAYDYSSSSTVSDNRFNTQNTFNKVSLGKVPITSVHFYTRYYLNVEQLSLSEEAYQFWELVQSQQEAQGSIFQPNAIRIKGNVRSTTDQNEIVLGIFGVSAVTRQGIFVDPDEIPYTLSEPPQIPEDCRKVYSNATTTKPDFW